MYASRHTRAATSAAIAAAALALATPATALGERYEPFVTDFPKAVSQVYEPFVTDFPKPVSPVAYSPTAPLDVARSTSPAAQVVAAAEAGFDWWAAAAGAGASLVLAALLGLALVLRTRRTSVA
jgi:hypothetical protein